MHYGKHNALSIVVRRLSAESGDEMLLLRFAIAEKFHTNFDHDFMEDYQVEEQRPVVRNFVDRVLGLIRDPNPGD